jgi:hypothetical protein
VGVALLVTAVFVARRSPLSGGLVGAIAVGLLILTWVPTRVPVEPRRSRDPQAPGVLLPGSRPHPGVVTGYAAVLLLLVLGTALPAATLVRDAGVGAAVLTVLGVGAIVLVLLNLRSVGRAGRSLLLGPGGLSVPGLAEAPVPWDRVEGVVVSSAYERRGVPQHVPVVSVRLALTDGRRVRYDVRPVDLGPDPGRALDALERLVRGTLDRRVLDSEAGVGLFSAPTSPSTG